mgnify:CR=1 FL=1
MYPTTFLLNLSSTSWGVNWIEPTSAWSRKIDKTMRTVPGEFLGIGDSGFPVYSSITTTIPIEAFGSGKGYVWWTEFGVKRCSTGLITLLESWRSVNYYLIKLWRSYFEIAAVSFYLTCSISSDWHYEVLLLIFLTRYARYFAILILSLLINGQLAIWNLTEF